jgi:hypothetical protein
MHRRISTHRLVLTALFSVLLLWMQEETVRHALEHIGARIERAKHSALERPTGDVCVECEMLAAGTAAVPASLPSHFSGVVPWIDIAAPVTSAAIDVPSFYQSRAPPQILQLA